MTGKFYEEKDYFELLNRILEQSDISLNDFLDYTYSGIYGETKQQKSNWLAELSKYIYYEYTRPQKEKLIDKIPLNIGRTELWIRNKLSELVKKINNTEQNTEFYKSYVLWLERKYDIKEWSDELSKKYATWDNFSEFCTQLNKPDKGLFEKFYNDAIKFGDIELVKIEWKAKNQYIDYESGFSHWLQKTKNWQYGDNVHYDELLTEEFFLRVFRL